MELRDHYTLNLLVVGSNPTRAPLSYKPHTSGATLDVIRFSCKLGFMNKNKTLTATAYVFFAVSVIHIARVILGGEIILFGINFPYVLSIVIAIALSYLGWQLLNYRD